MLERTFRAIIPKSPGRLLSLAFVVCILFAGYYTYSLTDFFLIPILLLTGYAAGSFLRFADDSRALFRLLLRLIGGIDTDVIMQGKDAIQHEMDRKLTPLLPQGGYIPLADARIRKYVPFENYVYYRELLERMVFGNGNPV